MGFYQVAMKMNLPGGWRGYRELHLETLTINKIVLSMREREGWNMFQDNRKLYDSILLYPLFFGETCPGAS